MEPLVVLVMAETAPPPEDGGGGGGTRLRSSDDDEADVDVDEISASNAFCAGESSLVVGGMLPSSVRLDVFKLKAFAPVLAGVVAVVTTPAVDDGGGGKGLRLLALVVL